MYLTPYLHKKLVSCIRVAELILTKVFLYQLGIQTMKLSLNRVVARLSEETVKELFLL